MGVLPVNKKEGKRKGKKSIGPRIKNGHTNRKPNKDCQMMPPQKIDASNSASTSFSYCLLFFSNCYRSDWRDELECSLFLLLWLPKHNFVDLDWERFLVVARFEPSTFQYYTWKIRPQDHSLAWWNKGNI